MKYNKICKCCGLPFETPYSNKLYCDRDHYLPCPVCGKPVLKKKDRDFSRKPACCSVECSVIANKQNLPMKKCEICGELFKPKSGVATICDREHHINCSICGKDMIVTKTMWHDGIDTCSKECAKEKERRHNQEKYGVDHPMQSSVVQARHRASMKSKYGVESPLQSQQIKESAQRTNLERVLGQMIENLGYSVSYEYIINSRAFDIFVKELNTVIEVDPTWSHNTVDNFYHNPIKKDYHIKKSRIAEDAGMRCIHVFDWDATEKILDIVRPKQSIGARQCEVREVPVNECNQFLDKYHLQGKMYKQTYRYGLYYKDELVQLMTFGSARYDKKYDVELLRLCTKSGLAVVGGANKLFSFALKNNPEWTSIISYCDLAKFSGKVYTTLGMKEIRRTPPQAVWSKNSEKVTSMLLRQRGYDQLFKTNYGKGTSNEQLMLENGWLPVYDCGQAVFEWRKS